ncbi:MAG: cobalamin adenosyltransferase [Synergistales bacterium]|jgi:ethanolamine utilization cobalamin adenosyltransferase
MKLVTEKDLRREIEGKDEVRSYVLPPGTLITPAARTYLADRKVHLVEPGRDKPRRGEKREHETHLNGSTIVPKTDPRIAFRGRLDSLQAQIILAQAQLVQLGRRQLVEDLEEMLGLVRRILRSEVLALPLEPFSLMGMSAEEIREASHHPEKGTGVSHFMPEHGMGIEMALLNGLRVEVRETELAACRAFCRDENGDCCCTREDLVRAINRLSSAAYLMMCRLKSGRFYQGR